MDKVKDKYLSICHTKVKDRYGEYNFDPKIITYPGHVDKAFYDKNQLLKHKMVPIGKFKGTLIEELTEEQAKFYAGTRDFYLNKYFRDAFSNSKYSYLVRDRKHYATLKKRAQSKRKRKYKRKTKRKTTSKRKTKIGTELLYFKMKNCSWCTEFENTLWPEIKKTVKFPRMIIGPDSKDLVKKYGIKTYPALVKIQNNKHKLFKGERTLSKLMKFMQ